MLPVLLDPQVHPVPLVLPVQPALLDHKVTQAHRVLLAPLDLLVPQALQGRQEPQDLLVLPEIPDLPVQSVLRALQAL